MKITFINVGYGEAILIECGQFTMLIDGGSNEDAEFDGYPFRKRTVDYLMRTGTTHINLIVSTHIHEDHICGLLQVVRNIPVDNMWCNYHIPRCFIKSRIDLRLAESESQRKFINAVNDYNELTEILMNQGTVINEVHGIYESVKICEEIYGDILGPENHIADELKLRMDGLYKAEDDGVKKKIAAKLDSWMNITSVMMRLHAGPVKILLPGDANSGGYKHFEDKSDLLEADIFKLGHHGQMDSVSQELIEKINPAVVIACASSDRRYESANPKIFEIIERSSRIFKPVFLFSDNVYLSPYSQGMKEHSALVIYVDEISGEVTWLYE